MNPARSRRMAVLVSGSGRSLRNLLEREREGKLPVRTVLVLSSKEGVGALSHARDFGVPSAVVPAADVTRALEDAAAEIVVLAGYVRRWPITPGFVGRAINIHPSLLPLFGGRGYFGHHVHEAALASGMRVSGCTVHYVTEDYDRGAIIAQRAVPILPGDTADSLAARVFAEELELLPRVVRLLAEDLVRLEGGITVFAPGVVP